MISKAALVAAAASLLLAHPGQAQSLYGKNSAVVQISGMDYDRVIAKSNYTSIVEFYAPWCGHCKNLKPAYESAAKSLAGIAKVAAVNCDDEMNKPFCGQMGVQGFPTLKIVRPSKKAGKPIVEDYQGQRAAKAIVEAVKAKIPNTVKKVTDQTLDEWLNEKNETAKAILFSDKGLISATLKALAIDFGGLVSVAQIRNKETAATKMFGIEKVPTLILLPGGTQEPIFHQGEMKKEAMVEFLSQVAPPNPDCPPPKAKKSKSKKDDKATPKSPKASSSKVSSSEKPVKSTTPEVKDDTIPVPAEEPRPTIPVLSERSELEASCLNDNAKTCVIAMLPKDETSEAATTALASLASIHKKHRASHIFPFFGVSAANPLASPLISNLKLGGENEVHLIATNAKRGWWKKYSGQSFDAVQVEAWVDAIRMGEGKKEKLPDSVITTGEAPKPKKEEPVEQQPIQIEIEEIIEETPDESLATEPKTEEPVEDRPVQITPEHSEL
ncbi:thioredoxin-domain-containing protein [Delitschia confertaspora ATCC 74209]|uniref:protein disulfide-isomerase n=1 Tax=Delitschia confertaspora ATCC 74209 TaxID=1513339 RepID=A0A9P4JS10_9PLEO|nr:thioredoxin-domain-containing protein [Delitschia confertaspora ATCC 74209]